MKIEHKILKIKKSDNINTSYIESEIKKLGFNPLRWAITKIDENDYVVDCAVII